MQLLVGTCSAFDNVQLSGLGVARWLSVIRGVQATMRPSLEIDRKDLLNGMVTKAHNAMRTADHRTAYAVCRALGSQNSPRSA